jgi:hypothetical protein
MDKFDPVQMSNKYYPLKVWLLTILMAPIFFLLTRIIIKGSPGINDGVVKGIFYFILFGALYSIPSFVVFYFSFKLLIRQNMPAITLKLILFILAALLTFLTCNLIIEGPGFIHTINWDDLTLPVIYSVAILFSCLLYRIRKAH